MPQQLSIIQKLRIVSKIEDGWSIRLLAEEFNVNKNTILKIKRKWENEGTVERKVGTGRPRKTSEEQDTTLVNYLRNHPFDNASKAKFETNFPASVRTALRRVKKSDLKNCAAAKKYQLTEEKKQGRLIFALNHLLNDADFWRNVIFSDEKIFQSHNDGGIRVYRPPRSRFNENYIAPNDRSGRFSVNVWAWMSMEGLGVCWNIDGRLNSRKYLEILDNVMLPSVRQRFPDDNFIFQHDNCSVHTANCVRSYLDENNVEVLPWAAKSPDMNPLENIWGIMVTKMQKQNVIPLNKNHLWSLIEETWESLAESHNLTTNLIDSMPRRMQEVINNNGTMTRY